MAEVGSWLALTSEVLYTKTLTREEMPTQSPSGELYLAGVFASVDGSIAESKPFDAGSSSGGEFSVKNTSAGEFFPSVSICATKVSSSS